MMEYICVKGTLDLLITKWDKEISRKKDKKNYLIWKEKYIKNFNDKKILMYYGILDNDIICEATVSLVASIVQNGEDLVNEDTVYLSGFRTDKEYIGKGYFSELYKFMENDLKNLGYNNLTLGVEPSEVKNMQIYFKWGYDNYIKTNYEIYPDDEKIMVNYYLKKIN